MASGPLMKSTTAETYPSDMLTAVKWMALNCTSNSELATLSNVCESWRKVVCRAIIECIFSSSCDQLEGQQMRVVSYPVEVLLLPSMVQEFLRRRKRGTTNDHHPFSALKNHTIDETYCLAWFAPLGIKIASVPFGDDSSDEDDSSSSSSCVMKMRRRKVDRRVVMFGGVSCLDGDEHSCRKQTCGSSWEGYSDAMDVLMPFGYSSAFVQEVFKEASERCDDNDIDDLKPSALNHTDQIRPPTPKTSSKFSSSTHAVRGAIEARPEGIGFDYDFESRQESDRVKRKRMQQLLPRLILSTRDKTPYLTNTDADSSSPPYHRHRDVVKRRQRSLQFLNADGSRAVRLKTPPFDCGMVAQPVTIFCVAIATEDGCFLSGLKKRFELGHLYPVDPRDMLIDMSPVCIATDDCVTTSYLSSIASSREESQHATLPDFLKPSSVPDTDDSSECRSDQRNGSGSSESSDLPADETIYRGQIGPGMWHCYTAIFHGQNSVIRVDGLPQQPQQQRVNSSPSSCGVGKLDGLTIGSDHHFDMSLCFGGGEAGEGEGAISELAVFKGVLPLQDLIQIERHLMSKHGIVPAVLPDGSKPKEEMTTTPATRPVGSLSQEDEWRRQAHALIVQPAPWKLTGQGVPLRVAARHRSVAWHRTSDVTGKVMRVARIGSKTSTGSSDW